jgi:glycerol uptake operon antiterminator
MTEVTPQKRISPIIPAIRSVDDISRLPDRGQGRWMFLLGGTLSTAQAAVLTLHARGWRVFLHVDMLRGLSTDFEGMRFLRGYVSPDGIITTHSQTVAHAKKVGLFTIQRIFLLDSQSVATGVGQAKAVLPDAVETLPGILPHVTQRIVRELSCPVITGGLVTTLEQVGQALKSGASAVSTSTPALWLSHHLDGEGSKK